MSAASRAVLRRGKPATDPGVRPYTSTTVAPRSRGCRARLSAVAFALRGNGETTTLIATFDSNAAPGQTQQGLHYSFQLPSSARTASTSDRSLRRMFPPQ